MTERNLDQFYTDPILARRYVEESFHYIQQDSDTLFVEPSAGSGSFLIPLQEMGRKVKGIDLEPKLESIQQGDFLDSPNLFTGEHSFIVVIGNPPFGKNASLAIKFFNQAAKYATAIAFIVPKTFGKRSTRKKIHQYFHLVHQEEVPEDSFIADGEPYDVPCYWQIWEKRRKPRKEIPIPDVSRYISYTTPDEADFAIRRVGFYAGRVMEQNVLNLSKTSHYFLKAHRPDITRRLKQVDWTPITCQTAGVRSLAKSEIATEVWRAYHG